MNFQNSRDKENTDYDKSFVLAMSEDSPNLIKIKVRRFIYR